MLRLSFYSFFFLLLYLPLCTVAADASILSGGELAQQVYHRPDGEDVSTFGKMVLIEEGHAPRVRELYTYRKEQGQGEVASLIRFTAPADIRDVGLLTLDYSGEESDQWLYLPELRRERRIPSTRRGGRFVGSDLYYEDLQDREPERDRHHLLGREKIGGVHCKVLESIPIEASNSAYGKRVSWIHPETLVPLRVDYYLPGREQPSKRFTVHRLKKVQGYWTVMDSTMQDLQSKHQTRLEVERVVYDKGLPDNFFSRSILEDPGREMEYRP